MLFNIWVTLNKMMTIKNVIILFFLCFISVQFFFAHHFLTAPINVLNSEKTDALVVFTGSANRVKTAAELFQKGYAHFLYISGVNQQSTKKMIIEKIGIKNLNTDRIYIDYAKNTKENVQQTILWLQKNNIQSIRLVTSFYHMNRAHMMLMNKMPELKIIPHVVQDTQTKRKASEIIRSVEKAITELWYARFEFLKFQYAFFANLF